MLLSRVTRQLPHLNASARYEWFHDNIVVFRDVFNPTTDLILRLTLVPPCATRLHDRSQHHVELGKLTNQ